MNKDKIGGFYKYTAIVWDDVTSRKEKVHGLIYGKDFSEVGQAIKYYYGDTIFSINLYLLEEGEVYEFETQNEDNHLFTLQINDNEE